MQNCKNNKFWMVYGYYSILFTFTFSILLNSHIKALNANNTGSPNILLNMRLCSPCPVSHSRLYPVSTGSGGGCVPTDVLQSAATFLPPSPLAASAPWSPATATSSSARVQVGFNLWWQQLYWAMNTMNSPAPTHLLLHRGTSDHKIHHLFLIYLEILNLLLRM